MNAVLLTLLVAGGCNPGSGGEVDAEGLRTHQGEDFALSLPEGAALRREGDGLAVDLPGGARWFDVRWVPSTTTAQAVFATWAERSCMPVRWDRVAHPHEGVWTVGGTCMIEERTHWVLASVEQHGDDALFTVYLANREQIPFEDAVVDQVTTALSLGGGDSPVPTPDRAELRASIRQIASDGGIGTVPVPGGGELSARVSESLASLWERRAADPPPRSLDP